MGEREAAAGEPHGTRAERAERDPTVYRAERDGRDLRPDDA